MSCFHFPSPEKCQGNVRMNSQDVFTTLPLMLKDTEEEMERLCACALDSLLFSAFAFTPGGSFYFRCCTVSPLFPWERNFSRKNLCTEEPSKKIQKITKKFDQNIVHLTKMKFHPWQDKETKIKTHSLTWLACLKAHQITLMFPFIIETCHGWKYNIHVHMTLPCS